jgi:hypothetical protein
MRYRALDEDGDMVMGNGNAYIENVEAVQQAVATRLRLLIYESWEDYPTGTPWWQDIIAQRGLEEALRIIKKRIEGTTNVLTVLDMEHTWDNESRTLYVRAAVQSVYGLFELNEALGGEV